MKTISFTMDDETFDMAVEAICATYGYQATLPNPAAGQEGKPVPNPQAAQDFAAAHVKNHVRTIMADRQIGLARQAANDAANAAVTAALDQKTVGVEITTTP